MLAKKLDNETMRQWELTFKDDSFPIFEEFIEFIDRRARAFAAAEVGRPNSNK